MGDMHTIIAIVALDGAFCAGWLWAMFRLVDPKGV